MNLSIGRISLGFAAVVLCTRAVAEDAERCDAVLAAKQYVSVKDEEQFLEAVARATDRKTLKESSERLNIGLYDVIDADGDGWRKAVDRVRRNESRFTSRASAQAYLFEGPAEGAVSAWATCMEKKQGPSFFAYLTKGTGATSVGVTLSWSKGPNDQSVLDVTMPGDKDFKLELDPGDHQLFFSRPAKSERPRELVFNGRYSTGWFSGRNVTATVVLHPADYFISQPSQPIQPILSLTRLNSRGKCDPPGHDGRNEFRVEMFLDGGLFFGPETIVVGSNGSVQLTDRAPILLPLSRETKGVITAKFAEMNGGTARTHIAERTEAIDFSTELPKSISMSAMLTKRSSRRTCHATLDFVISRPSM